MLWHDSFYWNSCHAGDSKTQETVAAFYGQLPKEVLWPGACNGKMAIGKCKKLIDILPTDDKIELHGIMQFFFWRFIQRTTTHF